jgi:hypothetical protein
MRSKFNKIEGELKCTNEIVRKEVNKLIF